MPAIGQYLFNVLHVLDQLLNVLLGGDPRMTMSARMGRDIAAGRCQLCRPVCWLLSKLDTNHCARAWASEQQGVDASMQITKE